MENYNFIPQNNYDGKNFFTVQTSLKWNVIQMT